MAWSKGKIQFWRKLKKRQGRETRKTKNIKKEVVTQGSNPSDKQNYLYLRVYSSYKLTDLNIEWAMTQLVLQVFTVFEPNNLSSTLQPNY